MSEDLARYLQEINFDKYFNELTQKLKNKKVVIYGTGSLFKFVQKNYDLSKLNIIAICDTKFTRKQDGTEFLGYKTVTRTQITDLHPDYVLVATLHYLTPVEDFSKNFFRGTNTKIRPLARRPLFRSLKEIWCE